MFSIRATTILLAFGCFGLQVSAAPQPAATPAPLLQWFDESDSPSWTVPALAPESDSDEAAVPLLASPWYEDASDLSIEIIGGEPFEVERHRGRIVLLDFWATWCGPCRKELPALQRLYDQEHDSGVDVVAVNVDEPDNVAMAMISGLGLSLPVGRFNDRLAGILDSRTLPAVLLLDGEGRIRKRWSGYREGIVELFRREIHTLLAGDPGGFSPMLGAGTVHGDRYGVRWSRDLSRPVGGLAVLTTPDGVPVVVATSGRELVSLRRDGKIVGRLDAPTGMVSLLAVDLNDDGVRDLVGYRRGSRKVATYDFIARAGTTWDAPAGLFSMRARQEAGRPPELWAGTADGVLRLAADGSSLGDAGQAAGGGTWTQVTGEGMSGFGVGSSEVLAAAAGRFGGGESDQIALSTKDGTVLILEAGTGALQYKASWSGVTALAAGDLDGDGVDELLVASGGYVTALELQSLPEQP